MGLEGFWKVSRELASLSRRRTRWLVGLADPQEPIQSIMPGHADQIIQHRSHFGSRYMSDPCCTAGLFAEEIEASYKASYKAFTRFLTRLSLGFTRCLCMAFTMLPSRLLQGFF